jgi:hypothetical protein
MARHMPVTHTSSVVITAHSSPFAAPILYTTTFSDQAVTTLVSTSTRWGPVLVSSVRESTPIIFSFPV